MRSELINSWVLSSSVNGAFREFFISLKSDNSLKEINLKNKMSQDVKPLIERLEIFEVTLRIDMITSP